jgi:hypothetical protein
MSEASMVLKRYNMVRSESQAAQSRFRAVSLVRTGRASQVFKGMFPSDWPAPVIANMVDIAAQDSAEQAGVMPTLTAFGDDALNDSSRRRASKLTQIVNGYAYDTRLGNSLVTAADYLITFGTTILRVEPNFDKSNPHIHVDSPLGTYIERDRFEKVIGYFKTWNRPARELANLYPEHASRLIGKQYGASDQSNRTLTLIKFYNEDGTAMLLVEQEPGLVLDAYEHPLGRIPVAMAQRPTLDGQPRGQFDETLWVFAARARLALLNLEAATKAVEAPIAVPSDVTEFAFGPDAVIRSNTPERIRRVSLEIPQTAMMEQRTLQDELRLSTRMPDVRMGETDSSVVTGRGVQALMGGFDSRIRTYQSLIGEAIADSMGMCLELDERLWPNESKVLVGAANGSPYTVTYTPAKDIKGSYQVTAEYGIMAGLDANRALIWGLQALGAGLTSKSFIRKNLPVSLDVAQEEQVIDVENLRSTLMSSVSAYAQAIPEMAAQGQDASGPVRAIADLIAARKKGTPVEKAVSDIFAPPEPEAPAEGEAPVEPGMEAMMGGAPAPGGVDLPQAPPSDNVQQLLSQLSGGGRATSSVRTMRSAAI